jgi:hypothetical protein
MGKHGRFSPVLPWTVPRDELGWVDEPPEFDHDWFSERVDVMATYCRTNSYGDEALHLAVRVLWMILKHAHLKQDMGVMVRACTAIGIKMTGAHHHDVISDMCIGSNDYKKARRQVRLCESAILVTLDYRVPSQCLLDFVDTEDAEVVKLCNALVKEQDAYDFDRLEETASRLTAAAALLKLNANQG